MFKSVSRHFLQLVLLQLIHTPLIGIDPSVQFFTHWSFCKKVVESHLLQVRAFVQFKQLVLHDSQVLLSVLNVEGGQGV